MYNINVKIRKKHNKIKVEELSHSGVLYLVKKQEDERRGELRYQRVRNGLFVKRLRHHPFTVGSWVRIPHGSPIDKVMEKA